MSRRRRETSEIRRRPTTIRYGMESLSADEVRRLGIIDLHAHFYTHMLIEDVSLWIMPWASTDESGAKAVLDAENPAAEEIVAAALGRGYDLTDSVRNLFHQCAATMVGYSHAPYEIVYHYPKDSDTAIGFELFSIFPFSLRVEEDGQISQYVPEQFVATGSFPPKILVPADRLVRFQPPSEYREALASAMASLLMIERSRGSNLMIESMQAGTDVLPYDFQHHKHSENVAVAEATRAIGWDARGTFRENQLEYYQLYRQLVFMRFVAKCRESLVDDINAVLNSASVVLGPLGQLRMEGLPTVADVDEALGHLESGNRSFKDILAPFLAR